VTGIHIISRYGYTGKEIKYELEIDIANQLIACHWMSLGLEVEYSTDAAMNQIKLQSELIHASTRKHNWNIE